MTERERADLELGARRLRHFERALELRDLVRAKLAAAVGAPPESLSLTTSTTNGCNIVLAGLGGGDEVLTTDSESTSACSARSPPRRLRCAWPGCATSRPRIVQRAARRRDAERLIALSHVCWVTETASIAELREALGCPCSRTALRAQVRWPSGDRGRLLYILLPEVALRPGLDGRARRA
jgi:selenocysteine lyase/cysteine desulfurase